MQRTTIFLGLVALVLLAGCIDIEVHEKVYSDGTAVINETIYLQRFLEYLAETNETIDTEEIYQQMADSWVANCSFSSGSYTMNGSSQFPNIKECGVIPEEKALYLATERIPVEDINQTFKVKDNFISKRYILIIQGNENAEQLASIMNVTYYISMPGTIKNITAGTIEDNQAVITLADLNEDIVIVSEELNMLVIVIIAVIILAIIAFVLMKKG